jgi:hypothetical protein
MDLKYFLSWPELMTMLIYVLKHISSISEKYFTY